MQLSLGNLVSYAPHTMIFERIGRAGAPLAAAPAALVSAASSRNLVEQEAFLKTVHTSVRATSPRAAPAVSPSAKLQVTSAICVSTLKHLFYPIQ